MIGRKLGNRYEVIEQIGGGGMAVVYKALDTLLGRYVSIKVLRPQFSTDEDFVRRFRREAQAAASLSHPNVVNIYDVGMEGQEEYYIVMEFIDGLTLKEVIQDRAPLPVGEAIDIAKQICAALGHAHENNIVHRDIKPHNILIGKDGRVKVTDFGIARAISSNTITQDGSVLGSVHYFSPEQARGGLTDVKSDIYSLGVVLYEMVTGELPFSGESPISVALKHLQDHFVEPRQINPALPQSVENIVLKSLAKDPTVRYQNAREMYRDLEKALLYPNVPKFNVPAFDEQKTIQMPAVSLRDADPLPSRVQKNTGEASNNAGKPNPVQQEDNAEKKPRKFWRPVIWLLVIFLLLGVGAVTAYSIVTNYLGEKDVTMPNVTGKPYNDAVKELVNAGLDVNNIHREDKQDNEHPRDEVISQSEYEGKTIKANREITLTVSSGPEDIKMPNVMSMSKSDALAQLKSSGVSEANVTVEEQEDRNATPGAVIRQDPAQGVTIAPDTKIHLTVAKAVEKVKIPDLQGQAVDDAKKRLTDLGLKVGNVIKSDDPKVEKDRVIKLTPYQIGSEVEKGTTVDMYVSNGAPQQDGGTQAEDGPQKITVQVTVDVKQGDKAKVKIVRTDAIGTKDVVNDEITATKTYNVACTVEKDQMASIEVYKDGVKIRTIPVSYEQAQGQDLGQ